MLHVFRRKFDRNFLSRQIPECSAMLISDIQKHLYHCATQVINFYRPQRSCEGYIFTGVCLSTGGVPDPGVPPLGGAWSWGGSAPERGLLLGVPGPRGVCSQGRLVSQHALRQTPSRETATAADGTHPTGMHSC